MIFNRRVNTGFDRIPTAPVAHFISFKILLGHVALQLGQQLAQFFFLYFITMLRPRRLTLLYFRVSMACGQNAKRRSHTPASLAR